MNGEYRADAAYEFDEGVKDSLVGGWWSGGSPESESSRAALRLDGSACQIAPRRLSPELLSGISFFTDIFVGFFVFYLCLTTFELEGRFGDILAVLVPLVMSAAVTGFWALGVYLLPSILSPKAQLSRCLPVLFSVGVIGLFGGYLYLGSVWPEVVAVTSLPLLMVLIVRILSSYLWSKLSELGVLCSAVAVIGDRQCVERARRVLRRIPSSGLTRFRGYYFDELTSAQNNRQMLQTLVTDVRAGLVDEIVLISRANSERRVLALARTLRNLPVDVRFYPEWSRSLNNLIGSSRRAWQTATISLSEKPQKSWGGVQKATFDRVCALALLLISSPLFLILVVAVKATSRGPVFFVQQRFGFNCKPFGIYKFRSMYIEQCDAVASRLTSRNDPRVTSIGAFLRKTSLDELPQLINVLKGDMSLVGPRPHVTHAKAGGRLYDELIPIFHSRYRVKPGLTGLAQVRGQRGNTETEISLTSRFRSDMEYIRSWSLSLDIKILFWTIVAVLRTRNAF